MISSLTLATHKAHCSGYPGLDSSFVSKLGGPRLESSQKIPTSLRTFDPRKNIAYVVRAFTELYNAGEIPLITGLC